MEIKKKTEKKKPLTLAIPKIFTCNSVLKFFQFASFGLHSSYL